MNPSSVDRHPRRWRMLALLASAELLGVASWFTASAVSPQLRAFPLLALGPAAGIAAIRRLGD